MGQTAANPLGLYDILGNVFEWCADHWHDSYRGAPRAGSVQAGLYGAASRVIRGGSWNFVTRLVRGAFRDGHDLSDRDDELGFRCARVQNGEGSSIAKRRPATTSAALGER